MKAKEFDRRFDQGEDISDSLDLTSVKRVNQTPRRISVDFPSWMVDDLDREARRLGITRQSLITLWIAERLKAT